MPKFRLKAEPSIDKMEEIKNVGNGSGRDWTSVFNIENVTRVGVILLLLYLVQILVGIYRYKQRLAGFYRGRYQALTLIDPNGVTVKELGELMVALTPEAVDFGKAPAHPTEQFIQLAKNLRRSRSET